MPKKPSDGNPSNPSVNAPRERSKTSFDPVMAEKMVVVESASQNPEIAQAQVQLHQDIIAVGYSEERADQCVVVYTMCRNGGRDHRDARDMVTRYLQMRNRGVAHENALGLVVAFSPTPNVSVGGALSDIATEASSTVLVAASALAEEGAENASGDDTLTAPVQLDLDRMKADFVVTVDPRMPQGFDAFNPATWQKSEDVRTKDVSAAVANVRRRLATITVDGPPLREAADSPQNKAPASDADATFVEAAVHSKQLIEEEIRRQGMAVFQVLLSRNIALDLAQEGALFYAERLRIGIPGSIVWGQTVVYCTQRQRGAGPDQAKLIADKKVAEIPERDESLAPEVEDAMRAQLQKGRGNIRTILAVGFGVAVTVAVGAGIVYALAHTDQTSVEATDGDTD